MLRRGPPSRRPSAASPGSWRASRAAPAACMVLAVVAVLVLSLQLRSALQGNSAIDLARAAASADSGGPQHAAARLAAAVQQQPPAAALLPGYQERRLPAAAPSDYMLKEMPDPQMEHQRQQVAAYLGSEVYRDRLAQVRSSPHQRGILISAGGRKLSTHLLVTLRVLRHHLRCKLPVEVAWQGPKEMDGAMLAALDREYGPVLGVDISTVPYPQHQRKGVKLQRWEGKVFALLHSRFREVLLLDSDSLPLRDPAALFASPQYLRDGNLFWPDVWQGWVGQGAYSLLGLNASKTKEVLHSGQGWSQRDAESGQLLLDRGRHLDALEWSFMINSFSDKLYYKHIHGDKDTFALAFALAGKAHEYAQVQLPPGGVFRWGRDQLETKASKATGDGWQLAGVLQYNVAGQPAFYHRTMDKWELDTPTWSLELATGPLPARWAAYYLAHDTQGPTKGVWWEHVVPHHALAPLDLAPASISLPVAADAGSGGGWQQHVLGPEQLLPVRCEQLKLAYRLTLLTDPTQEMLQACAGLWGAGSSLGQAGKHGGGSSSGSRAWWHWGRHKPQQKASGQGSAAPGDTAQQAAPGSPQLQDGDDDSVDADLYSSTDLAAGGAATAPAVPSEPADAVPEELAVSRKLVPLVKDWASRAAGSGSGDDPLEASGSSAEQEGLSQQLVPKDVGLEVDGVLYSPAYLEQYVTGPDGAVVPSDAAIPALRLSADVPSAGLQMIWRGLQELAWVSEHREQYPVLVNGP